MCVSGFVIFGLGWEDDPYVDVVWSWEPTLRFQN